MSRRLLITADDIEIEKIGDVARVSIKHFGDYQQVGEVINFEYEDEEKDSNIAYVISKILEVL